MSIKTNLNWLESALLFIWLYISLVESPHLSLLHIDCSFRLRSEFFKETTNIFRSILKRDTENCLNLGKRKERKLLLTIWLLATCKPTEWSLHEHSLATFHVDGISIWVFEGIWHSCQFNGKPKFFTWGQSLSSVHTLSISMKLLIDWQAKCRTAL